MVSGRWMQVPKQANFSRIDSGKRLGQLQRLIRLPIRGSSRSGVLVSLLVGSFLAMFLHSIAPAYPAVPRPEAFIGSVSIAKSLKLDPHDLQPLPQQTTQSSGSRTDADDHLDTVNKGQPLVSAKDESQSVVSARDRSQPVPDAGDKTQPLLKAADFQGSREPRNVSVSASDRPPARLKDIESILGPATASFKKLPQHLQQDGMTETGTEDSSKWGQSGVGLASKEISHVADDVSWLNLKAIRSLPAREYQKLDHEVDFATLPDLRVAVLDMDRGLAQCLDFAKCKRALGGWDYSLHLFFSLHAVSVQEADFLYIPFYQFCYQDKKKCVVKGVEAALNYEVSRAKDHLKSVGRENVTLVLPMSHDFGACARFSYHGYEDGFQYQRILRDVIVLQPNGDFDTDCYSPGKDIVVPAFTGMPHFSKKSYRLSDFFQHSADVKKASVREHLLFAGFSKSFSQRKEGVRPWLMTESNWKDPSSLLLKRASKIEQYIEYLSNSAFCLIPPGVVGWTGRIWENLYAGCIPVVIAEKTTFPFESLIDYRLFTLRFTFDELDKIEPTLRSLPGKDRDRLQEEGLKVRDNFMWPSVQSIANQNISNQSPLYNILTELRYRKKLMSDSS